jgi:hypothetical protein
MPEYHNCVGSTRTGATLSPGFFGPHARAAQRDCNDRSLYKSETRLGATWPVAVAVRAKRAGVRDIANGKSGVKKGHAKTDVAYSD